MMLDIIQEYSKRLFLFVLFLQLCNDFQIDSSSSWFTFSIHHSLASGAIFLKCKLDHVNTCRVLCC